MSEKLSNILEQFRHAVVLPNADLKEFAAKATESRVHIARHTFQVTEEDFGKRLMLFPMYVDANLILQPNKNRYLLSLASKFVIHADACFDKDNIMRDLNISKVRRLVTDDFAEEEQLPGFEWWYEMYATSVALTANIASQPDYLIRFMFPFRIHQSQAEFDKRMEHQQDQQELYELAIDPEEYETDEFTSLVESNSDEYGRIPWNDPHYFVQGGSTLQLASTSTEPVFDSGLLQTLMGSTHIPVDQISDSFPQIYTDFIAVTRSFHKAMARQFGYGEEQLVEDSWARQLE